MSNHRPVSIELHHEVERFLYQEARMLDHEQLREWLENMLDPQISYKMVIREERFRKDRSKATSKEVLPYDDDYNALALRVTQVETGLRTMLDPPERLRRFVTNVEAFHTDKDDEYLVLSYGAVTRFRRLYEEEQVVYGREDIVKRGPDGGLRLLSREIVLDQRVSRNKNLLFFF